MPRLENRARQKNKQYAQHIITADQIVFENHKISEDENDLEKPGKRSLSQKYKHGQGRDHDMRQLHPKRIGRRARDTIQQKAPHERMTFAARIDDQFRNAVAVAREQPMVRLVNKKFMVPDTDKAYRKIKQRQRMDVFLLVFQS